MNGTIVNPKKKKKDKTRGHHRPCEDNEDTHTFGKGKRGGGEEGRKLGQDKTSIE
jgi:hypothetical protein